MTILSDRSTSAPATANGSGTALPKSAAGVAWDLSALFASPDDPGIERCMQDLSSRAADFEKRYRGTVAVAGGPAAAHLLAALNELEALQSDAIEVSAYARLLFAADTRPEENRTLVQRVEEALAALRNQTLFFDLEWLEVADGDAERLAADPQLTNYRHYLLSERRFKPHTLSEAEERLMNDKDLTGIAAWQRLFTEFTSTAKYPVEVDGEVRELNQSEVLTLLRGPDRDLRRRAHESLYQTLERNSQVTSFIYDTRFNDHLITNRLRRYEHPMQPRHLANEVDGAAVDTMLAVVERNYSVAQRYFALKARALGLEKLELYDQYAPLFDAKERIGYDEARDIVLRALGRFSQEFAGMAQRFFDERWIDADPRQGKRGGAFCAGVTPQSHPFILMSYNDDMRDVMTLAHELGHGLHDLLASKQTLFNYYPSLPVAETASVFAEMLVFDDLLAGIDDPKKRLALICGKLEDSFATVFRQTVLTRFEQLVYEARGKGRLGGPEIGKLWLRANQPYYGDTVELTTGYEWGWSYIPHFINTPFYCYAYAFGELLVLALYGMYRHQGAAFVPRYAELLASGGSQAPKEQMAALGIDIRDERFWQVGFDELARLVDQAEALMERTRAPGMEASADARL